MDHVSRRSLLATASATAAAAGVVAVVGSRVNEAGATPAAAASKAAPKAAPLSAHVVARVRDLDAGEVDLFLGEKEVTVRDSTLAHAIARAAQQHTA